MLLDVNFSIYKYISKSKVESKHLLKHQELTYIIVLTSKL